MKDNVTKFDFCYGCGVCEIICPHKIIDIRLNQAGFYVPVIDKPEKCTECGLCLGICAHNDAKLPERERKEIKGYAGWSKNELTRLRSSSGGLGFEIGRYLIEQGYKAVGCKFNVDENRAEHFVATSEEEFRCSVGSKYIPSFTIPGFSKLNRKEKFFVTGTPCQIDSVRRWARKMKCEQNFVLLDFFCHGVPSMNLWKKYSAMLAGKIGKLKHVSWRSKLAGWHDSYAIAAQGDRQGKRVIWDASRGVYSQEKETVIFSKLTNGDVFYGFFLRDVCFGKACYKTCKYKKTKSSADIRIGDLWGKKYKDNKEGVSVCMSFTREGDSVLAGLSDRVQLVDEPLEIVTEGQMEGCARPKVYTNFVLWLLKTRLPLKLIWRMLPCSYRATVAMCYRKMKKLIKGM